MLRRTNEPKKAWTKAARKALVELYLDGMDIAWLSKHFEGQPYEIVLQLSELLLEISNPIQDTGAKNYGKTWSWVDNSKLWRMYAVRTPIPQIAAKLGRDELGVCFRLLSEQMVVLPRKIVEEFNLDEDDFAVELDEKPSPSVCSFCFDVVIYCKCQGVNLSIRLDEN